MSYHRSLNGRKVFCFYLLLLSTFVSSIGTNQDEPGDRLIACRYDDERVVFVLSKIPDQFHKLRDEGVLENLAVLGPPVAKLTGIPKLLELDGTALKGFSEQIGNTHIGDPWLLEVGASTTFHLRIEKLALTSLWCQEVIAAIARVSDDDKAAFKAVRRKYYLARPGQQAPPPEYADQSRRPALLKWTNKRELGTQEKLEAVLEAQLAHELKKVREAANYPSGVSKILGFLTRHG